MNKLMECALSQNDDKMARVLNCDDLVLKGVYLNGCMTKYLLKSSPKNEQKQDSDLSSNEIAFQNLIHEINDDLVVHKKVFRMTQLLEKYKAYLPADIGTYSSAEAKRTAMNRNEEHVKLLIDHLNERMADPFEVEDHPQALINIFTGMHASREIEISLLDVVEPYKLIRPYDRCGLTQIRPYIKWMFRPYHIFMRPTANPALYQMEKNN